MQDRAKAIRRSCDVKDVEHTAHTRRGRAGAGAHGGLVQRRLDLDECLGEFADGGAAEVLGAEHVLEREPRVDKRRDNQLPLAVVERQHALALFDKVHLLLVRAALTAHVGGAARHAGDNDERQVDF